MKFYYITFFYLLTFFLACKDYKSNKKTVSENNKVQSAPLVSQNKSNIPISSEKTKVYSEANNVENPKKTLDAKPLTVKKKKEPFIAPAPPYHIYFTLDDGPQNPGTHNCRKILKENNIKATFFFIGLHDLRPEGHKIADSIHNDPLFIVGNHSYSHAYNKYTKFYKNPKAALKDFILADSILHIKKKIARLPGRNTWDFNNKLHGESSAFNVAKKLDSIGYNIFGWDVEWKFTHVNSPLETPQEMIRKVEFAIQDGRTFRPGNVVILVHDRMFGTAIHADSLKKFLLYFKNSKNYIFETLDNYPLK